MTPYLHQSLFLIGFAGSGKTTVGRLLAKRLRVRFYDTDRIVEQQTGKRVREIFASKGERHFRSLETQAIAGLTRLITTPAVVALGGGAFIKAHNRKLVALSGHSIYLQCAQRELYRRLRNAADRPLLVTETSSQGALRARIAVLLNRRMRGYRAADIVVSTTKRSPAEVVEQVVLKLRIVNATD